MLTGCGIELDARETHSARAFPYAGQTLTIKSSVGGLRILPGSGDEVRVDRWLRGKAADSATWSLEGDALRLGADCTMIFGDCGARYHVRVPPGVRLVVDGSDDGIILDKITQDAEVSSSGPIRAYGTSGRLRLRGHDSLIAGTGLRSADVRARTGSGSITLSFAVPPDNLDALSGDGRVTATVPRSAYAVTVHSRHGKERSQIKSSQSPRTIVARSTTGDVRVNAGRSPAAAP